MISQNKFHQLLALLIFVAFCGCTSGIGRGMFRVKYLGDSEKVLTAKTPPGFLVSPEEALEIEREQRGRSIATRDFYYDETHYYVCDGFFGSVPKNALKSGLKIDGKTGEPFDPWDDSAEQIRE